MTAQIMDFSRAPDGLRRLPTWLLWKSEQQAGSNH